jgi:hypothetical protein
MGQHPPIRIKDALGSLIPNELCCALSTERSELLPFVSGIRRVGFWFSLFCPLGLVRAYALNSEGSLGRSG